MDVFHHAGRRTLPTVDGSTRQFEYRQARFSGTEMELFTNHKYYDAYIGYAAFMYCDSLTSIFTPSSVDGMLNQVFSHSPNLETIYCEHTHKPAGWHDDWDQIDDGVGHPNRVKWYSETPVYGGNHWHYVGGVPTIWVI